MNSKLITQITGVVLIFFALGSILAWGVFHSGLVNRSIMPWGTMLCTPTQDPKCQYDVFYLKTMSEPSGLWINNSGLLGACMILVFIFILILLIIGIITLIKPNISRYIFLIGGIISLVALVIGMIGLSATNGDYSYHLGFYLPFDPPWFV